jgi:hypothetical protein
VYNCDARREEVSSFAPTRRASSSTVASTLWEGGVSSEGAGAGDVPSNV